MTYILKIMKFLSEEFCQLKVYNYLFLQNNFINELPKDFNKLKNPERTYLDDQLLEKYKLAPLIDKHGKKYVSRKQLLSMTI